MNDTPRATSAAGDNPVSLDRETVAWAWAQPIVNNPGARVVLLALAAMADDAWECIASQEEIAEAALVPARSVRRYMEHLEDGGHIQRHRRFDENGHRLSDRCRLNPGESLPARLDGRQVRPVANLAGREDEPPAKMAGRQVNPPAILAGGQEDLWPIWPVVEEDETDTPWSEPVANLAGREDDQRPIWPVANLASGSDLLTGQIGRASTSPTEKYEEKNLSSSSKKPAKSKPDEPPREDVEQLCARLLQWLIKKDYRQRPSSVTDGWRNEARKLLDLDHVRLDEALDVLDWSQRDIRFWAQNINSMPTFRKQYGQLELKSRGLRGNSGAQVHQLRATGTDGHQSYRNPADASVYYEELKS